MTPEDHPGAGCCWPGSRVGNSFRSRHQEPQTPQRPDSHLRHGHFVFWFSLALGETTPRWAPSLKVMERKGRAHRPSHPAWSDSGPGVEGRRKAPQPSVSSWTDAGSPALSVDPTAGAPLPPSTSTPAPSPLDTWVSLARAHPLPWPLGSAGRWEESPCRPGTQHRVGPQ